MARIVSSWSLKRMGLLAFVTNLQFKKAVVNDPSQGTTNAPARSLLRRLHGRRSHSALARTHDPRCRRHVVHVAHHEHQSAPLRRALRLTEPARPLLGERSAG